MSAPAPPGPGILRDPSALMAADAANLLPAAGFAGAQVRSVAGQLAGLPSIDRPRSMLVIGRSAMIDAAVLTSIAVGRSVAPVVWAPSLPAWVGPLDVVVVLAGRQDDEAAAADAADALRRGAVTVVRGASTGLVADAAGRSLLPAAISVPESMAGSARWSLLAGVAALAGLIPQPDLSAAADLLDAVALRLHPMADSFRNTAVNLAEFFSDGSALLIGTDQISDVVAAHAASVLAGLAGVAASTMASTVAEASPALLGRMGRKDIFADPFADEDPAARIRPVLLSAVPDIGLGSPQDGRRAGPDDGRRLLSGLRRMLPGAMTLDIVDSLETGPGPAAPGSLRRLFEPEPPPLSPAGGQRRPDPLSGALRLAIQLEFTAVYLGICAGQLIPMDFPDGLGRSGGTRWAVRPDTLAEGAARQPDSWD